MLSLEDYITLLLSLQKGLACQALSGKIATRRVTELSTSDVL